MLYMQNFKFVFTALVIFVVLRIFFFSIDKSERKHSYDRILQSYTALENLPPECSYDERAEHRDKFVAKVGLHLRRWPDDRMGDMVKFRSHFQQAILD